MDRLILLSSLFFSLMPLIKAETLNSRFAGSWYSGSETALKKELKGYLNKVKIKKYSNVIALMLPHAGYRYSGQVAAAGIAAIAGQKFKRVIILGPSHSIAMRDAVSIPEYKYYQTPLGKTPLDQAFIAKLRKYKFVRSIQRAHINEHSVQIELPLLQYILKNQFKLVPIIVGQMTATGSAKIAAALRPLLDDQTLIVISSDFTHYGSRFFYTPFPLNKKTPANIKKLDDGALKLIIEIKPDKFRQYQTRTGATICGRGPIEILLRLLPPKTKSHLLAYDTSGRMTNSYRSSVSYASCVFTGSWQKQAKGAPKIKIISPESQKLLLQLARGVIEYYLKTRTIPTPKKLNIKINPDMRKIMGAFVTLHKQGRLRGCIGEIIPRRPLWQAVQAQAYNAAFNDWRFSPVKSGELKNIDIEISALTPPKLIKSYKDIKLGRDGIILSRYNRSAVFLPQVAPEQGWTLAETLTQLSRKAGQGPNDWKSDGTKFKTFQAQVFGEKHK
jgi:MEMO1 family protein